MRKGCQKLRQVRSEWVIVKSPRCGDEVAKVLEPEHCAEVGL